jgi:hypothetical protein
MLLISKLFVSFFISEESNYMGRGFHRIDYYICEESHAELRRDSAEAVSVDDLQKMVEGPIGGSETGSFVGKYKVKSLRKGDWSHYFVTVEESEIISHCPGLIPMNIIYHVKKSTWRGDFALI